MKLRHNSRSPQFRTPFGAVKLGTKVRLSCTVEDIDPQLVACTLRLWIDGEGEELVPMEYGEESVFSAEITRETPAIVWYSFIVKATDQAELRIGAAPGKQGGEGVVYDYQEVPSFQLTFYRPRAQRPSWYEDGIVYQVFPDRFARDGEWRERCETEAGKSRCGSTKRIVEDWDTPPVYERNPDNSITTWDFYGGSLKGLQGKLPHLVEMGVTAIYLNPIFEAVSNHRYDTANYLHIDPMLGTDEDFTELCDAAHACGIGIILDGVFNHTGDDSVYFNRYGNYPEPGAFQKTGSPWDDAYHMNPDGTYECWWGVANMPNLNEDSPAVRELLLGEDGVIRHWLRAGADGWRLDVADELSDEFIAQIKTAALAEKPDALLLGEVWEDASNKISYGKLRRYLLGDELDAAMNYPFRSMLIDFLTSAPGYTAYDAAEAISALAENYPPEALRCSLNLLDSHDRPRIISVLGGAPDPDSVPENERATWRVPAEALGLAKARFWLATLMQMTFPGVPSIYYGDEAGLQGLNDPGNRSPYPWGHEDIDFLTMVKNAASLRRAMPLFTTDAIEAHALNDDVLMYTRQGTCGERVTMLINRSVQRAHTVQIPFIGESACDLISGHDLHRTEDDMAEVTLYPLGSSAVHFHNGQRLQKPLEHGWGVMCHITSIPNKKGHGTLGEPARHFIDHLAQMGASYWQVLPVNPTDEHNSPYAGPSAFAGNTDLLEESAEELTCAFEEFKRADGHIKASYTAFVQSNAHWLEPYAAFMAIKDLHGGASRHEWDARYAHFDEALRTDPTLRARIDFHIFAQYRFDTEWRALKEYANERGIQIIGDIPMYVSDDSADVWSEPKLFNLDTEGAPSQIAGTPPDRFSTTGQVWGNPTYNWKQMRNEGYRWWIARLRRALDLYDHVRLDHFLGFQSYFSIPAGKPGTEGRWMPGPGLELFRCAQEELGDLPLIAEDLGYLTPAVRALVGECGFPGMDVLEFCDEDVRGCMPVRDSAIVYTSTHDTATLMGWIGKRWFGDETGTEEATRTCADDICRRAFTSSAPLVMMPLQDVMHLGDEARMNVPGTTGGNWTWQADETQVAQAVDSIRRLAQETGRVRAAEVRVS